MPRRDVADALTQAARTINTPVTFEATLQAIVFSARDTVPDIDHVGISVAHRDGSMQTLATTDELVERLDELQYEIGDGPCVYAMRGHGTVHIDHAATEDRWRAFLQRAVQLGLRSQLGIQLFVDDQMLGGLNLYSTSSDVISADDVHLAEMSATHATLAFQRARKEQQLTDAASTRKVIGQALGILMERYRLTEDRAFEFLARTSQTSNIKLRDIAQELVDVANQQNAPNQIGT